MISRVHLIVNARDASLLIDKEADPVGPLCVRIGACAVSDRHFAVGVAEQRKFEIILAGERRVGFDAVEARAENLDIVFVEIALLVAEPAAFDGSARGVGHGIEP